MKTIEEKAKAYDEALEKAKEILEMTSDKSAIYTIFSELAESEDEKVRKGIIELVKQSSEILNKNNQERMLAWLEKQGEKKTPIWRHWKNGIAGNGEGKLIYLVKMDNTYILTSCLGFECDYIELSELDKLLSEKQSEQKPDPYNGISFEYNGHIWGMCARDNGVDISCDKHLIKHLEMQGEQKSITFNNAHIIDSALNDYCCKQYDALHKENGGVLSFARLQHLAMDIYGWCKGQIEQTAWSEEDEERYDSCIACIIACSTGDGVDIANIEWFKSIRKRLKGE